MPYEYLEDIAVSDVAFRAWGETPGIMFAAAADALMNTMVEDLDSISYKLTRGIQVEETGIDMLLFEFLQEIIYFKDAESLLLRVPEVEIREQSGTYALYAEARGEQVDAEKHELLVDVKAVTFHRYSVEENEKGWEAVVILDT